MATDIERLLDEQEIDLEQAARILKRSPATVYDYTTKGLRGVTLETFRVGTVKTTVQAVQRFRLAVARKCAPATPEEYQRAHQRRAAVRRELEEEGL